MTTGMQAILKWRDLLDLKDDAEAADERVKMTEKQIASLQAKLPQLREAAKTAWAKHKEAYDSFPTEIDDGTTTGK